MNTDTPRTDAAVLWADSYQGKFINLVPADFANELERELAASKAEVERLRGLVNESIVEKSNLSIALVNCQADLRG